MKDLMRGFTERESATDPAEVDPRLRGRTYTIPFDTVWRASLALVDRGMLGWTLGRSNDEVGVIDALARAPLVGTETDVRIRVGLDVNAQTRVDVKARSRKARGDFGRSRRLIGRFLKRLDRQLGARPGQILDPTARPEYQELT